MTDATKLAGLTGEERKYEIEHRGKSIPENRRLQLKYGKATRPFKMAEVSNSPFTDVSSSRSFRRSTQMHLPDNLRSMARANTEDGKLPWMRTK